MGIIKSDRAQIKRALASKNRIKDKIKQLETSIGSYKFDDIGIPEESLALYISVNPRDLHKAGLKMLKEISNKLYNNDMINPYTLSLNCVQTTASKRKYFDVDVDNKGGFNAYKKAINEIKEIIGDNFESIITRGGIHILINIQNNLPENWYPKIKNLTCEEFDIMMNGDGLTPIPGCRQGDFSPIIL